MRHARQPARGYALLFVLMLMIALGVVVGGLLTVLAQSVATSRAAHEDLQQMYGCDGAVRLALADADRHAGDVDNTRLKADLQGLSAALATDINPRTGRPYADLSSIDVVPSTRVVQIAYTLPFLGMRYAEEGNRITVAADTTGGRGRACQADAPNRRRTMSYFQFALASTDVVANPAGTLATPDTRGDVFVLTHSMPGVARRAELPSGAFTIQHVNLSGGDIYRPTPPSGQPWRFVNKSKRLGGLLGKKRKKKARRPTLEAFMKYPTDLGGIPDPTMSRFVKGADIRIINGDWYIPDAAGNFPGQRIWSDQPALASSATGLTYSAYERDEDGASRGGAAIVRYGLVDLAEGPGGVLTAKPLVRGFCATADAYAPVNNTVDAVTGSRVDCSAAGGLAAAVPAAEPDPFRAAAWRGFIDPTGDTPILPIVVDGAALIASLVTRAPNDLGDARCLGEEADCPVDKRFEGSIWIGTLPGGSNPSASSPRVPCPLIAHPPPSPVIGPALACARPNAVVLYNLHDLNAFLDELRGKGLSIGSNLPIYVVGDVNAAMPAALDARMALLAPQITALTRDFDFGAVAWGAGGSPGNASANLTWNVSLFTSWATENIAQRDPSAHVIRKLQGDVNVNITGSVVTMFTAGQYLSKTDFNKSKGSYSSNPDPAVTGLPVFSNDTMNLAGGSVRFPGTDTRDLRRTEIEHQPPNAPRLSVDLQPLDKR